MAEPDEFALPAPVSPCRVLGGDADHELADRSCRRSGLLRTVLVQYFPDGHNMVIVAANNGMPHQPGWYFIQPEGHPLADVEIDGKR